MAPCKRPNGTIPKCSPSPLLPEERSFVANRKPLVLRSTRQTVLEWSHRLAWPRTEPSQGLNTGSNPVGTTTTYAIPPKSCDTGVTRVSVDNSGPATSAPPLLQHLDARAQMTGSQMRVAERHLDIAMARQRCHFRQWPPGLHQPADKRMPEGMQADPG
jgi:hypothetical protein